MSDLYVSVIIITCNNPTIFDCVECVRRQIEEGDEIIIVQDNSTEAYHRILQAYCKAHNIILLQGEIHGNRAHNRNMGAAKAGNPILVFLDADTLLVDTSIPSVKAGHATRNSTAFIGTRSAGRYDPLRMSIFSGINVWEITHKDIQLDFLSELPCIRDTRGGAAYHPDDIPEQKYYWIYYYTCCCSVWRESFARLGGFDEDYSGWGVEDIDLGYRIGTTGRISFLPGFCGIHIPHEREIIYAEQDNCRNLKRLLKKTQTFDVEFISVYRVSAGQLEQIRGFLNRVRMLNLPLLCPDADAVNTLYINSVSINAPYGQMIYCGRDGNQETYHLIGIGTFFGDKSITEVIVSSAIVLYPASVICGILQECLRIGKTVVLDGTLPDFRLDWSDFPNLTLVQAQKRNEYRIHDLMEFQFKKIPGKDRYVITSDYLELENAKNIPAKLPLEELKAVNLPLHVYCVINLTRGVGYRILIKQIKTVLHLRFVGIYSVSADSSSTESITRYPEHLYGLLSLNTPLLLIVEDLHSFRFDFVHWEEREHTNDIIVDLSGGISYPKSWEN